jgi:hypothetical protein
VTINIVKQSVQTVIMAGIILATLHACTSQESMEIDQLKFDNQAIKLRLDRLEEKVAALSEERKPSTESTATNKNPETANSNTAESATASHGFSDIAGVFGEKEIKDLANLGVFTTNYGKFEPKKPVTRGEFARWMVRTENLLYNNNLKLASDADSPTYSDVPSTASDFKYIQGLANTGYLSKYDEQLFRPDAPLTREDMLGLKVPVDWAGAACLFEGTHEASAYTDGDKVSPKLKGVFYFDDLGSAQNLSRTFASAKNIEPQKAVTRAEACVCLWKFGGKKDKSIGLEPKTAASG